MTPIVGRLEAEYGEMVDFYRLNAEDGGPGEAAFEQYALRGHPAILVIRADSEVERTALGITPREEVEQALNAALGD